MNKQRLLELAGITEGEEQQGCCKFIANGGKARSLKDYMTKVDSKYPITGPRNALN